MMSPAGFAAVAPKVTHWLIALAGEPDPPPATTWEERLVFAPIEELERDFADLIPADFGERARRALAGFGDLPLVWEHRDFGPWNVVLEENGEPAAIDWEDAEPQGLPGLDLALLPRQRGLRDRRRTGRSAKGRAGPREQQAPARSRHGAGQGRHGLRRGVPRRSSASPTRTSAACACSAGSSSR